MTSPYIEALLTERAGYIARGKKDRVKAVDEALREIGYDSKYIVEEKEVASVEVKTEKAVSPTAKRKRITGNGDN